MGNRLWHRVCAGSGPLEAGRLGVNCAYLGSSLSTSGRLRPGAATQPSNMSSWYPSPMPAKVHGYSNPMGHFTAHHWGQFFLCAAPIAAVGLEVIPTGLSCVFSQSSLKKSLRQLRSFRECKLVQSLLKTVWWFLKHLKIELQYDPAILLLDLCPKELKAGTETDICTPVFTAALFTAAQR